MVKTKRFQDMSETKDTGLRWLSVDAIKTQCRIDFDCEDAELVQFGVAAEQAILDLTRRTYENFIDTYGRIPDPIFNATLLLTQSLYKNRDAEEQRDSKEIAFGFSFMVKNYMVLTGRSPLEVERDGLLDKMTVVMTEFDFDFGEIENPTDEQVEAYDTQRRDWRHSTTAMPIFSSRPHTSARSSARLSPRRKKTATKSLTLKRLRLWDTVQDS